MKSLSQLIFTALAWSPRQVVTKPENRDREIVQGPVQKQEKRYAGIYDRELTYEETHLNVDRKLIQQAIHNPNATYLEMDALWFSANNSDDYRVWQMLDAISERRAELIDKP